MNDLLDLSKIRAGKVALESLPIDLGQVLEECTSLFAGAAEGKGIDLIVCPPARAKHTLLGDPLRVRQILMNLVGNAVKFTSKRRGGRARGYRFDRGLAGDREARTSRTPASAWTRLRIGKIFEPFSQADETTTRTLRRHRACGLAICQRARSTSMDARITVTSTPGVGSTFCLALPLQVGEAVAALTGPEAWPPGEVRDDTLAGARRRRGAALASLAVAPCKCSLAA